MLTFDAAIEEELGRAFSAQVSATVAVGLQPSFLRRILKGLRRLAGEQVAMVSPVFLGSTPGRFHLKRLREPFLPEAVVLSPGEIPPVVRAQAVGTLR